MIIWAMLLAGMAVRAQGLPTDGPLTIRPVLQQLGERLLKGKTGSIVAINPENGEIICLATNTPQGADVRQAIGKPQAPGSTFKTAQALTLLSEGIVTPDTKMECQSGITDGNIKVAKEAYAPVVEGMRLAVEKGTATSIKASYPICGKTGTIENPGKDHSAFIAFAPMDRPKIAIAVYVEHGGFGADLAAPMAGLVIEAYLKGKLSAASEEKAKRIEKMKY